MKDFNSDGLYKALIEHMNEGVWVGNENEETVYANPKFCELVEYPLEEMIGKKSYVFWDKESAERVKNVNETKRKAGQVSSYEGNLLSKTGKLIPVLLNGSPLPEGGTVGIMTDLRELKKKETIYKRLIENMDEAVWMGDKEERTIYANPKFCKLMGFSLDEMMHKESYEFWDNKSAEKVRNVNQNERKQGRVSSYEGNLLTKDKKKIPVLLHGTPLPEGGSIGIMTDLRELKKKEEKAQILSKAIENANDCIIVFDEKGNIQTWNKGSKVVFGYKKDEIVGENLETLFQKNEVNNILNKSSDVLYKVEMSGKHKNKSDITISATLTPIFNKSKKKIASCLLIGRDITHNAKIEEELSFKIERIQEAYSQLGHVKRQMDYVFDLIDLNTQKQDLSEMGRFIVRSVLMLSGADASVLRLYNPNKESLELISYVGTSSDWAGKSSIPFEGSLAEDAFKKNASLRIIDLAKEPRFQSLQLAKSSNLYSLLLIPLQSNHTLLGTLSIYMSPKRSLEIFEDDFVEKYAKLIEIILAKRI